MGRDKHYGTTAEKGMSLTVRFMKSENREYSKFVNIQKKAWNHRARDSGWNARLLISLAICFWGWGQPLSPCSSLNYTLQILKDNLLSYLLTVDTKGRYFHTNRLRYLHLEDSTQAPSLHQPTDYFPSAARYCRAVSEVAKPRSSHFGRERRTQK